MSLPTKALIFDMGPCVSVPSLSEVNDFHTFLTPWASSIFAKTPFVRIVCKASQSLMDACDGFLVSEVDSTLEAKSVTAPNSLFLCLMIFSFVSELKGQETEM